MAVDELIESDVVARLGSQRSQEASGAVETLREDGGLYDGTLRAARLIGANLEGADLEGADLSEARLEWADLRGATLRGATLRAARLEVASLQRADLSGADLREASLLKAQLQGARLTDADLSGAALGEANFQGADLARADLRGARLSLADLQGADLEGANLEGVDLLGATLHEANLERANLQGAYLGEATLRRARMQGADLRHATLAGAKLRLVNLQGAQMQGARLGVADLQWADLSGADLTRAQLLRARLLAASLRGATLHAVDLTGADLSQADLTDADLSGAELAECTFDDATILPDGTPWSPEVSLRRFTDPRHPDFWNPEATADVLVAPARVAVQPAPITAPEAARPSVAPVFPEPTVKTKSAARKQIRGSSLLLVGRMISMVVNFAVQVLTVRYLSKTDYGAFAYALSMVSLGETIVTLGLDRAVTRFVPIYQEQKDYNRMFGTLAMVFGTILSLGLTIILLMIGFRGTITGSLIDDREAVALLTILIALSPVQALDNVINGLFAVFSSPKAIFFRKYVLAPGLKLTVVILLILGKSDVEFLAAGYLAAGVVGVSIFSYILIRVMREQQLFDHLHWRQVRIPAREVLSFTVPLLASDLVYVVMNTVDAVLLEKFQGTADVAAFRAVQPTAKLNQMVLTSFALLFTPAAARLFARKDSEGINSLYWENAAWVAIGSFPIFALTFSLAEPVTVLLYSTRYEQSALIMAMLSFGYFFNAATGQNGLTLKVLGKLRYIVVVDIVAAAINLGLNLVLIPRYGAMGAAVGTMSTLIIFNIMKQLGLMLGTGISLFDRNYIRVYATLTAATVGLLLLQVLVDPPVVVGLIFVGVASLLVIRINRASLNVEQMFPELFRIPLLRWLLAG